LRALVVKPKPHPQKHDFSRISVNAQAPVRTQPKLAVNTPGNVYEHEVDRIAEQGNTSGAGRPDMDQRFGHDFSRVSVHAETMPPLALLGQTRNALMASLGEGAGRIAIETASTETKGAEGMTVGRRVHLAPGRFDAQSHEGRVRLGHEMAHAIQQERGAGLSSALAPGHRAALEMEAECAGCAFADGRRFSVMGKAPTTAALFRGPGEEQKPEVDEQLDAAIQEVTDRQVARGAAIARDRKERHDYILAHLAYREYDVPVDERLRKTPAALQPQELWIRVLQMEFPTMTRNDAEEILRRTGMKVWSLESDSTAEHIRTRDKIRFRTKYMKLLEAVYNEIVEDRARTLLNVKELLNAGPDMALEMTKDVGRGIYNGILGFGQGVVDLPLAPVNLVQSLRGGEQLHTLDLSGLRAGYGTSYGVHYGSSIELGTELGLTVVSGRLPLGAGTGTSAVASTASRASRAARLWIKLNAVSAGATSVVQAGQAIRDIARGYVIEDGKKRPLTEDDILGRLAGIAFGLHAAKSALRTTPTKPGAGPAFTPSPDVPDLTIERTTPSKIQVSVPGEPGKLVIDDAGWRVLAADGQVLAQGSPDEGALLAFKLGEAQAPQPAPPATTPAAPSPDTTSGQTAQAPRPANTLSVVQGGGQYSGKPRGLVFDSDLTSRSVRVDTSHPIFKNRRPANDQNVPPAPQAKAMQASAPVASEPAGMPKVEAVLGASPAGGTAEPARAMAGKGQVGVEHQSNIRSSTAQEHEARHSRAQASPATAPAPTRKETIADFVKRGGVINQAEKPPDQNTVTARPKSGSAPPEGFQDISEQTGVEEREKLIGGTLSREEDLLAAERARARERGIDVHQYNKELDEWALNRLAKGDTKISDKLFIDERPPSNAKFEYPLADLDIEAGTTYFADAVDFDEGIIYEIKSDAPGQAELGQSKLDRVYKPLMEKKHPRVGGWKTKIVRYSREVAEQLLYGSGESSPDRSAESSADLVKADE
jgi:hypothetical protein